MRRDSNDENWQRVKQEVYERDQGRDRFLMCLTDAQAQQFFQNWKSNGSQFIRVLDPAHVLAVSNHSALMYEACNIVTINRIAHDCLDHYKSPLTGKPIPAEIQKNWWKLILGKEQYNELIKFKEAQIFFDVS